jgi:hypothetical protein
VTKICTATLSEWISVREAVSRGFPRMFVGNMRVSTDGDRPALDALLTASVDDRHLFEDRVG